MDAPEIVTEVESESRADRAVRRILLTGAPRLTYSYQRYRFRKSETEERTWQPETLTIRWGQGRLNRFKLNGHRVKKDGTVGVLSDSIEYDWYEARGAWLGREQWVGELKPPPEWVVQIVNAHKDNPPPFDVE